MKYLILIIVFLGFIITPAFAQEVNPSLTIEKLEISAENFNTVLRNAPIIPLDTVHSISWQITLDNIYFMRIQMEMQFLEYMINWIILNLLK